MKKEVRVELLVLYEGQDWTEYIILWIETLSKQYRETPAGSEGATEVVHLCNHVISKGSFWRLTPLLLLSVVRAGLLLGSEALIEKAMTVHPETLREEAYTELGGALHGLGPAYLHGEG